MINHRSSFVATVAATAIILGSTSAAFAEKAGTAVFNGLVQHVSSNNIKVQDPKTHQ